MKPYEFSLISPGITRANFLQFLAPVLAGAGSIFTGAISGLGGLVGGAAAAVPAVVGAAGKVAAGAVTGAGGIAQFLAANAQPIAELAGAGLGIYQTVTSVEAAKEQRKLYEKIYAGSTTPSPELTPVVSFPSITDLMGAKGGTPGIVEPGLVAEPAKDNTWLYIALGLGAILLLKKIK